ncbi:hypothetical protein [Streptomyces olivochromogenes]|nr:hypothetical protein [Streptomyces olivochromogenes]MCF3128842.1 hypothetical protein [Streptomyces olivochromogenes]
MSFDNRQGALLSGQFVTAAKDRVTLTQGDPEFEAQAGPRLRARTDSASQ